MSPSSQARHLGLAAIALSAAFPSFDTSPPRIYAPRFWKTPPVPRDDAGHLAAAEAKRQRKAAKKLACTCRSCGALQAKRRRQNTAYVIDEQNFDTLCPPCQQEADEYWEERWRELHADQLAGLRLSSKI